MHGVNATCYVQVRKDYCDAVSEYFRESTAVFSSRKIQAAVSKYAGYKGEGEGEREGERGDYYESLVRKITLFYH